MTTEAVDALLRALVVADSLDAACAGVLDSARSMLGADVVALVTWDAHGRPQQVAGTHPVRTQPLCTLPGGPGCPTSTPSPGCPAAGLLTIVDVALDPRWPAWAAAVAGAGYRSVQVVALPTPADRALALHAWAHRPGAFDADDRAHVVDVVRLASLMIAQLERVENLASALHSRTIIGQAQGLIMERFSIGSDEAMAYLRRLSQDQQVKVRDLARAVVEETGPGRGLSVNPPGPDAP